MSDLLKQVQAAQGDGDKVLDLARPVKAAETKIGAWMLKPGYAYNPYLSYPRNYPCFCGSGVKFKKCCINRLKPAIASKDEPKLRAEIEARIKAIESLRAEKK